MLYTILYTGSYSQYTRQYTWEILYTIPGDRFSSSILQ